MTTRSIFDNKSLNEEIDTVFSRADIKTPRKSDIEETKEEKPALPALPALSLAEVKQAVPGHLRSAVTEKLVDTLNAISTDPLIAENIRDNFIGYTAVLKEGKFKLQDYLHAVAYVSYKIMGYNNEEAYARTFPDRYATLTARGLSSKDISAYVAAYHKGKLVNLIMEQTLVPTWVLNQDIYQRAINVQVELMTTANSEKVRQEAANSLLTHLKKPETKEFQISIDTAETSGMREMREMITRLAQQQHELIRDQQMKTIDVASSRLIEPEDSEEDGNV